MTQKWQQPKADFFQRVYDLLNLGTNNFFFNFPLYFSEIKQVKEISFLKEYWCLNLMNLTYVNKNPPSAAAIFVSELRLVFGGGGIIKKEIYIPDLEKNFKAFIKV